MGRFVALFLLSVSLSVAATLLAVWATPRLAALRTKTAEAPVEDPTGAP